MSEVTKTSVDDATPVLVANAALGALAGNLQLAAVADRNWEPVAAQFGEVIQIPIRGAVTANDKTAGSDVTEQAPAMTNVQITLDTHKEVTVPVEDVAKAFSKLDVIQGYAEDAAVAIAEAIETAGFVAAYTNFTTNSDIGTAATDLDTNTVLLARKAMRDAKVPAGQEIYFFLSTKDYNALLMLPEWRDAEKLGSADRVVNAPGQFRHFGMTFVESQYVQVVSTTTHNLCLSPKQGLALAVRPLPLPQGVISAVMAGGVAGTSTAGLGIRQILAYRPEKLATQLTLDALFGWKVIRGAFGQDVLS